MPPRAWIFQATPQSRDLAAALASTDALSWSVARYGRDIHVGDRVYYWQSGHDAGIYGVGSVAEVSSRGPTGRYGVRTIHERALFAPITRAELRAIPALRDLALLRQPRGTVFALSAEQDVALAQRAGAAILVVAGPAARRRGRTLRLVPAVDGDAARRVEDAVARGDGVVAALVARDGTVAYAQVAGLRRRRDGLALRLGPAYDPLGLTLAPETVERLRDEDVALALPAALTRAASQDPGSARMVAEPPSAYRPAPAFAPAAAEVAGDLVVPPSVVAQLVAAVSAGRHVILMGVPGTGKTTLALGLARAAERAGLCAGSLLSTATADWTTFDTIGGLVPAADGTLRFSEGVALRALREDRWLIVDELNRADVDKAFGPLLTVLAGGPVELPAPAPNGQLVRIVPADGPTGLRDNAATYGVGPGWRLVGTLNTLDRAALFSFSLALARRFAFVLVPPPAPAETIALLCRRTPLDERSVAVFERLLSATPRPLGPAILIDAARYVVARTDPIAPAEAIGLFVLPQLEGIERPALSRLDATLAPVLGPDGAAVLHGYIEALYGED